MERNIILMTSTNRTIYVVSNFCHFLGKSLFKIIKKMIWAQLNELFVNVIYNLYHLEQFQ